MNITKVVLEADSTSIKTAKKDLDALQGSGEQAQKSVTGLGTAAKAAGTLIAGLAASFSIREVIQYADEWQNASNRLRLVTSSSKELAETQQILIRVANETRAGFSGTAELFTVLTRSTQDLGLSQTEIVGITKTLNQSFAVSGASAGAMDGAIRQLSQGLQSGQLRGEEFNSVAEQAPGILDAVAFSLNMGRGELREFAATGGITSAVLVKAIKDYADVINNEFSKAQRTFGQSLQEARNNALAFVGGSNQVQTATRLAGEAIVLMSRNLDTLAAAIGITAVGMAGQYVVGVAAAGTATTSLTAAVGVLRAALLALAGPAGVIVTAGAAMYILVQRQKELAEESWQVAQRFDGVRSSLGQLTQNELASAIQSEYELINQLKEKQRTLQVLFDTQGMYEDELRVINLRVIEAESNHGLLVRQLERTNEGFGTTGAAANSAEAYLYSLENGFETFNVDVLTAHEYLRLMTGSTKAADTSVQDFVRSMDSAARASHNTESAYVQLMGVTDQVTVRTTRLTAEQRSANLTNVDALDSIDGIVEKMGQQKTVSAELTQVISQMRNDISSAFADMMMNGGNAFDNIAKSFERMVYKMVADWAAAGIMNMVSKAFGGAGGQTSVIGSIVSGGASAAGSAVVSGAAGTAAAGTAGAAAAGGGIVSGVTGAVGTAASSVGGAISGAGSAAMGLLKAIPGWGWALGGAALVAKLLDDSGTMSSNSGILLSDLPGVAADRKRDTPAYASGVDPVLFARRDSFDNAMQISEALRAADSAVMELFGAAGKSFRITGPELSAFDEKGGGFGQFFGVAAEDGRVALTAQQSVEKYVRELISAGNRYTGSSIAVSGSVDNMLMQLAQGLGFDGSNANGLDYVPFDGYRSILHQGEAVITARGNDALGMMASALTEMRTIMAAVAQHTAKSARQLERWDFGGLPEERAFA